MRFVEGGLTDSSVSRTSFDWGVPVPGSAGHVMYVWVDALTNYLTGARLSRRYRAVAPLLAGRTAYDRQGHGALPRGLLAGFPDVGGDRAARSRCSATASCSTAARRCRRASAMSSIRWSWPSASASMRCAISCCAKCRSARTAAIAPRRSSPAAMPISPTASAISRSARLSMIFKNCDGELPAARRRGRRRELLALVEQATRTRRARGVRALRFLDRASRRGCARCSPATNMSTRRRPGRCARPIRERMARRARHARSVAIARARRGRSRRSFRHSADEAADRCIDAGEGGRADRRSRRRSSRGSSSRGAKPAADADR